MVGRTDNAEIPRPLLDSLNKIFGTTEAEELFEQTFGEKNVILFGEGYGGKVQGVGNEYRPDESFILFDVLIGENYQTREWVREDGTDVWHQGCSSVIHWPSSGWH